MTTRVVIPFLDPYRYELPHACDVCREAFCDDDCDPDAIPTCDHGYPQGRGCEDCMWDVYADMDRCSCIVHIETHYSGTCTRTWTDDNETPTSPLP